MADVEKVKQGLFRCFMKCNEPFAIGCGQCPYVGMCYPSANEYESPETAALYTDTIALIDEMQEEIARLKKPADGTWIQKADAMGHTYSMCSACETVINTPDGCGGYYKLDMTGAKYCPNCGAKMY